MIIEKPKILATKRKHRFVKQKGSLQHLLRLIREVNWELYVIAIQASTSQEKNNLSLLINKIRQTQQEIWLIANSINSNKTLKLLVKIDDEKPKGLTEIIREQLIYDDTGKCLNAFRILHDPEILRLAYESIKSNPGNMVYGSDKITLDGISVNWFSQAFYSLKNGSYKPRPARRVYIPKTNGKMRPLGISSPRDKIIQQAMRIVMETVLEPKFLETSHGFRPSRGCHTALSSIREWKGVSWFLEGDIKSFFDSIDHHLLAELINKHFREARLIKLYWKMVRAGYIEWDKKSPVSFYTLTEEFHKEVSSVRFYRIWFYMNWMYIWKN